MAFTSRRGRPRAPSPHADTGTPELRAKRSIGITTEPIDLCLTRNLISPAQHWCGLHWRWLYTLRYGAPTLTSRYEADSPGMAQAGEEGPWRIARNQEYQEARALLQNRKRYDPVMRLTVFNELPAFLNPSLQARAWHTPALARRLSEAHHILCEGLELLVTQWKQQSRNEYAAITAQGRPNSLPFS